MVPRSPSQVFSCISTIVPDGGSRVWDGTWGNAWVTPHKNGMRMMRIVPRCHVIIVWKDLKRIYSIVIPFKPTQKLILIPKLFRGYRWDWGQAMFGKCELESGCQLAHHFPAGAGPMPGACDMAIPRPAEQPTWRGLESRNKANRI